MSESLAEVATRHQVYLEGLKTGEAKKVDDFLRAAARDIRKKLGGVDLQGIDRRRMEQLASVVGNTTSRQMTKFTNGVMEQGKLLAQYEAELEARTLSGVINVTMSIPTALQLETAVFSTPFTEGTLMEPLFANVGIEAKSRIEKAIRLGYYQGETTPEIISRLVGTPSRAFKDGVLGTVKINAETVTRTALQHIAQQARESIWGSNKKYIKAVQWLSVIDSRTSSQCRSLDGQVFEHGKGPRPPIHYNCRSTTKAVLHNNAFEKGATRAARSSADARKINYISAKTNYYEWLKDQPGAFQDSVLGKARAKLLRDGGLSAERFAKLQLGKNFRPLTLTAMKDLEPVAFNRAGI